MLKESDSLADVLLKMIKAKKIQMDEKNDQDGLSGTVSLAVVRQAIQSGYEEMKALTLLGHQISSDKQETYQSLLQSEMFSTIMDALYDGVYVTDGDGVTMHVNRAYEQITGIPASRIVGMHMREVEESGYISKSISLEVIKQNKSVTQMQRLANGREVMVSGTPAVDQDGKIQFIVSVVRDMTDLVTLQAELEDYKEWQETVESYVLVDKTELLIAEDDNTLSFFSMARRVAETTATVCLLGESGVGKTKAATYIHEHSSRKEKPFVVVNCGALTEALVEAELFGYAPGSFTGGLVKGKKGLIEMANGGTLFLDEVAELPPAMQVKLLKVLDEQAFTPVGSTELKRVDIRVISATNQDIHTLVKQGKLREDFYYRISVVPLIIEPLRKRPKEVRQLIHFFLQDFNRRHQRNIKLTSAALSALERHSWPGNIRELKNTVEYIVATSASQAAGMEQLPIAFLGVSNQEGSGLKQAVQEFEKRLIEQAMITYKTTREAAKSLGISQSSLVAKRNQ